MSIEDELYTKKILEEQESSDGAKLLRSLGIPYTFNSDYDMKISEYVLTKEQIADRLNINIHTWLGRLKLRWILHKSYFTATRTYYVFFAFLEDERYLIKITDVGY